MAWDDQQSRDAWGSYRAAGLRWLAAGVICAGLVVVGGQVVLASSRSLLAEGAATEATVVAADAQAVTFDYDAAGRAFTETLDIVSGRQYVVGEKVEVRYDRDDPGTARLLDEPRRTPGVGPALVVLSIGAAGSIPIGIGVLLRAWAWGRAMRREPWTLARIRVRGTDVALLPSAGDDTVRARMLSTTHWRRKTLQGIDGQELWMLPVGARDVVLTADGTGTIYGLRRRSIRPSP